ncbi:hypothetical protein WISP_73500 [Willisornis vidua]|uniref:Uncharacterized protein n=1 Tax=Willisornis vidua TaxID=1566151 RepID=A0ABQ9D6Q9_9PASS|nr:hypothetical protein WISP_73500 [Willisornis vidua]
MHCGIQCVKGLVKKIESGVLHGQLISSIPSWSVPLSIWGRQESVIRQLRQSPVIDLVHNTLMQECGMPKIAPVPGMIVPYPPVVGFLHESRAEDWSRQRRLQQAARQGQDPGDEEKEKEEEKEERKKKKEEDRTEECSAPGAHPGWSRKQSYVLTNIYDWPLKKYTQVLKGSIKDAAEAPALWLMPSLPILGNGLSQGIFRASRALGM